MTKAAAPRFGVCSAEWLCIPRPQLRWADQDTYLVLDEFGWFGCAWRETDGGSVDREMLIRALVNGEFSKPVRIVAFNTSEVVP